jgi:hypothetical protein
VSAEDIAGFETKVTISCESLNQDKYYVPMSDSWSIIDKMNLLANIQRYRTRRHMATSEQRSACKVSFIDRVRCAPWFGELRMAQFSSGRGLMQAGYAL